MDRQAVWLNICAAVIIVCAVAVGLIVVDKKNTKTNAASEPRVIKIKEVVGTVVGGPMSIQRGTGDEHIVYPVYVQSVGGVVRLDAERGCPLLIMGEKAVLRVGDGNDNRFDNPLYRYVGPAK